MAPSPSSGHTILLSANSNLYLRVFPLNFSATRYFFSGRANDSKQFDLKIQPCCELALVLEKNPKECSCHHTHLSHLVGLCIFLRKGRVSFYLSAILILV